MEINDLIEWLSETTSDILSKKSKMKSLNDKLRILPILTGGATLDTLTYGSDIDFTMILYDLDKPPVLRGRSLLRIVLRHLDLKLRRSIWGKKFGLKICRFAINNAGCRASRIIGKVLKGSVFYYCYHIQATIIPVEISIPMIDVLDDRYLLDLKLGILNAAKLANLKPKVPKVPISMYSPKGILRLWGMYIAFSYLYWKEDASSLLRLPKSLSEGLRFLLSKGWEASSRNLRVDEAVKILTRLKSECRRKQSRKRIAGLLNMGLISREEFEIISKVHEVLVRIAMKMRFQPYARSALSTTRDE